MRMILPREMLIVALCLVVSCTAISCDSDNPLTSGQAEALILADKKLSATSEMTSHLIDITPLDIWEQTGRQLFKNVEGTSSWDTFAVSAGSAVQIGMGFGGFGVTSAVPYDVNKDGTVDIVYAYSFGSGIHRSVIAWLDLENSTEHIVTNKPADMAFRQYDLILKLKKKQIEVYRIHGIDTSKTSMDVLRTYPAPSDIENMTLVKEGHLVWENGEMFNINN
ncbi:hypothetical protein [Paenibacillus sp. sgz5001063]|uniref:hypothetical protein n=1 Tax=Paenibacillus sp. sgz5001063 TaxID=3242474 RepID=UPI0036D21F77